MPDSPETWIPALNASLIVISGLCLIAGYVFIRRRQVRWHRLSMLTACGFAALFLVVYVTRAMLLPTKLYPEDAPLRTAYLALLFSHMVISVAVAPLALVTLRRALSGRFKRHRAIARVTLPLWVYTAVTGWMVYYMLYAVA